MPVPLMDVNAQWAGVLPQIKAAVSEVMDSGRFILGPNVAAFEKEAAAALGTSEAVGVANGTDALVLSLKALGIGPGDEVVVPAFTFYASAEAIAAVGATPVFADIALATFQLDPAAVEAAVTERTKAIMAVHLFGHPAPMAELNAIAARRGIPVIEDAAQAFGARLDGAPCGSLGTISTFSFFPTKNLPAFGDGGLVATSDPALAETVRKLRFHGSTDKRTFELVGHNSRLDELQAAILRILLRELPAWNASRRAVARRYAELGLGQHLDLPGVAAGAEEIYHLYMVRSADRARVLAALKEAGVSATPYYERAAHLQPVFEHLGYRTGSLPATERASAENIALPMFPTLGEAEQRVVAAAVASAYASV
jgi:dTDP-4-amino-4,6-dideoxygalactose transaminase